jgi:hypothetical protein
MDLSSILFIPLKADPHRVFCRGRDLEFVSPDTTNPAYVAGDFGHRG